MNEWQSKLAKIIKISPKNENYLQKDEKISKNLAKPLDLCDLMW